MAIKVVGIDGSPRAAQVSDFWFAQLDVRLGKIEAVAGRLERQVWMIACGAAVLMGIEMVAVLARLGQ